MEVDSSPVVEAETPNANQVVGHLKLLNEKDLEEYFALKDRFHQEVANAKRGEKVEIFNKRIKIIKDFVVKNDEDDWKRSFAAGILFLDNSIAINIKQLIQLMGKCKSSINGSLHQLGYVARPASKDTDEELIKGIPLFVNDRRELKKWTIRQKRTSRRRAQKKVVPIIEKTQNTLPSLCHAAPLPQINQISAQKTSLPHPRALPYVLIDPQPTPVKEETPAVPISRPVSFMVPVKFRYKMFDMYNHPLPVV